MKTPVIVRAGLNLALALAVAAGVGGTSSAQTAQPPLAIDTARITIAGTSNVHDYTASTVDARVTGVKFGCDAAAASFWTDLTTPGGLEAFDIAIAAGSLKSSKEGIDKNMHKALKAKEHADITFSMKRMEGAAGALKAIGTLRIAGVEREVTLPLTTTRKANTLAVSGALDLLMTDYGITPPKAMLGMLKTDPKVTVKFEVVLAAPKP